MADEEIQQIQSQISIKASGSILLPPIETTGLLESSDIDQRGFSRKLHKLVSEHRRDVGNQSTTSGKRKKFEPKNWKQLSERELNNLHPVLKSKFMVYEPTPKEIVEKQADSLKRVRTRHQKKNDSNVSIPLETMIQIEENSELIGQLKAAEARCRIKDSRVAYDKAWKSELQHLIKSQPTAKDAVRLQSFVPPNPMYMTVKDHLSKSERYRCEALLEDDLGLTVNRTL